MNFMTQLAKALPDVWKVIGTDQLRRDDDGLTIIVRENSYGHKGKYYISLLRPVDRHGQRPTLWVNDPPAGCDHEVDPTIYITVVKSVEQIAKDITRRLIPEAVRIHNLALKAIHESENFEDTRESTIERLAEILNTKPERHYQTHMLTGKVSPYEGLKDFGILGYGNFKVSGADSISLELNSISNAVALDLARALRGVLLSHGKAS